MNIPIVVHTLRDLSGWLECSRQNQKIINGIINELENADINEFRLNQMKRELSTKRFFHVRWLGDIYVANFGDGTSSAWFNYWTKVEDICQKNL